MFVLTKNTHHITLQMVSKSLNFNLFAFNFEFCPEEKLIHKKKILNIFWFETKF